MGSNNPEPVAMPATSAMSPGDHHFRSEGLRLWYRVAGRGPVLVVQAPGWGVGAGPYEATLSPLEQRFTVVYVEPRGGPRSDTPTEDTALNVGKMVQDLETLRVHLGLERFHLMGHSHGGLIALHYAASHPGRVTRLLAVNLQFVGALRGEAPPAGPVGEREPAFLEALEYFQSVGGFGHALALDDGRAIAAFLARVMPLYFRRATFSQALQDWLRTASISPHALRGTFASDAMFPLPGRAQRITAPTLIISGAYDIVCPPVTAFETQRLVADSELVVFEKSGHFPWVEESAAFFRAVNLFLTRSTDP